jgi:ArsR family transcriptional regulator
MTEIAKPSLSKCAVDYIHQDLVLVAQKDLVDGLTATYMARIFEAMADPTRVRLISALMNTKLCVCDLAAILGMTQSAISHQLRLLRDLRLVKAHKDGRMVYYVLEDEHIKELFLKTKEHIQHGSIADN